MTTNSRPALAKATEGVRLIEQAIRDILGSAKSGLTNNEITKLLGLESDQDGKQRNYLSWSVLGRMMKAGEIQRSECLEGNRKATRYCLSEKPRQQH